MLREYHLDIGIEVYQHRMSWRRFDTLLRALSPSSTTVAFLQARRATGDRAVRVAQSPEEGQALFEAMFRPPSGKEH